MVADWRALSSRCNALGHLLSDDELIAALCQAVLLPTIAAARCDAQEIDDVNAATSSAKRATRTIPPATRDGRSRDELVRGALRGLG